MSSLELFIKSKHISAAILQNSINKTNPIRKEFEKIYKRLSPEETECLSNYKGIGYQQINEFLYNKSLILTTPSNPISISNLVDESYNNITNKINTIDKLIDSYRTKEDCIVYRGIQLNDKLKHITKMKNDETITFDNYMSTSLSVQTAHQFTGFKPSKAISRHIMIINIKKDTPLFYLIWNSVKKSIKAETLNMSEFELLLPRGCVLELKEKKEIATTDIPFNYTWNSYNKNKEGLKTNEKMMFYIFNIKNINQSEILPLVQIDVNYKNLLNNSQHIFYIPQPTNQSSYNYPSIIPIVKQPTSKYKPSKPKLNSSKPKLNSSNSKLNSSNSKLNSSKPKSSKSKSSKPKSSKSKSSKPKSSKPKSSKPKII